jgi:peroxiredoxin Q/BCP
MGGCSIVWHPAKSKLLFALSFGRWFPRTRFSCHHTSDAPDLPSGRTTYGLSPLSLPDSLDAALKATKGRRMSQKTRKNSKSAASGPAGAQKAPGTPRKAGLSAATKSISRVSKTSSNPSTAPAKRATAAKPKANAPSVLQEGMQAPSFALPRDGGQSVGLKDYAGRKLVIFFYPRADTPGCTMEAADFSRLAGAFAASETAILGVSADPAKAQERFRDKHQLTVPLLSDEKHEMLKAYGAWGQKSMYGRTFEGILRTTVLIGRDGNIARIWPKVRVAGHAEEVLAAARAL